MLFQRLYNWIKYKTLPPSVLFKNRLFIERDSKHRRIFSNFGLTFRNSKWSNYSLYNIKSSFKNSFYKYIFILFFLIFLIYIIINFKQYYIFFYFFNNLSFLFWIGIDSCDYYFSFLIWFTTVIFSLFSNVIYSYFFFNHFSWNVKNTDVFFTNNFFKDTNLKNITKTNNINITKHDFNLILYSWLTNTKSKSNNLILEQIFDSTINTQFWNNFSNFFTKLYKITYLCNLSNPSNSIYSVQLLLNKFIFSNFKGNYFHFLTYLNSNNNFKNFSSISLFYILNNFDNYFSNKLILSNSLFFNKSKNEYNINMFLDELHKYNYLFNFKIGFFFFDNLNYGKLNSYLNKYSELSIMPLNLTNQITLAKWNRWLYRYSILHRKLLKNSHKLTLAKKLINTGFYNKSLIDSNIWTSNKLLKYNNEIFLNSIYNLYYSFFFTKNNNDHNLLVSNLYEKNNFNNLRNLHLLKFYENSYFWFLKRYYFFNTLPSNAIKINFLNKNLFLENNKHEILLKNNIKNNSILSFLLNSSYLNLNGFNHNNNNSFNFNLTNLNNETKDNLNFEYNLKDIYFLLNDSDLLNKENLNLLYWLNNSQTSLNFTFNYFNYFNNFNNFVEIESIFINKTPTDFNFNFYLISSLNNLDLFYLKDVEFLTYF